MSPGLAEASTNIARGYHEFIPGLFRKSSPTGPLSSIIEAAGLASLANAGNAHDWEEHAFVAYGRALDRVRKALTDPKLIKEDETLATVIMIGVFEVLNSLVLEVSY